MFSGNSRYKDQALVEVTTPDGRKVAAVTLRRPAETKGKARVATSYDRLDLIAHRELGDEMFYHRIGDANTVLDAHDLLAEPGAEFSLPE